MRIKLPCFQSKDSRFRQPSFEEKLYECRVNKHDVQDYALIAPCRTCHPIVNFLMDLPAVVYLAPIIGLTCYGMISAGTPVWLVAILGLIALKTVMGESY